MQHFRFCESFASAHNARVKPRAWSDRRLADLESRCKESRLSLTVQRRAILQSLAARDDHPTPDDVWSDVVERLPGVSRATVYRALDTLASAGLIVRASHPGSAARYDACTSRHHHLVCEKCGVMHDLMDPALDALKAPRLAGTGFRVKDYSVHFRGLCARCADTSARPRPKSRTRKRKQS
jgi:Fur family transcriptional regulator, peroxide stress response regulator